MNRDEFLDGANLLVTGGVGTVGRALIKQVLECPVASVRIIDNDESGLFELENHYANDSRVEFYLCDIRDAREMSRTFSGIDYCLHTAALKHVPLCERSPSSAVNTNVIGVNNVINAAMQNGVRKVLFTSSDKAVNPTSVMGTSKLMGERLFTAWNSFGSHDGTSTFASTRFGNVAGSSGSFIPLFCSQIAAGRPVTLTDNRMTRFIMTIEQAARLVIDSMILARGGEVFVTKMPVVRIEDVCRVLVGLVAPLFDRDPADVEIRVVGSRPGEKLWEELSTDEESRRIYSGDEFFVILPVSDFSSAPPELDYDGQRLVKTEAIYNSEHEPAMSDGEIETFLRGPGVLPDFISERLGS